jgi:hypothetical protein
VAIEVEDGTGKVNAVAYVSLAFVSSYQAARGRAAWSTLATDTVREQCIVRATDYIDLRFGHKFRGWKRSKAQALQWPRRDAVDNSGHSLDAIPTQLQRATAEYALITGLVGELAARPSPPAGTQVVATGAVTAGSGGGGALRALTEIVGPLHESRTYAVRAQAPRGESGLVSAYNLPEYPLADLWIAELIESSSSRRLVGGMG